MYITIRMDDITPGMKREAFQRFRALLDKYDIRPLIGVVPACRDASLAYEENDPDFWETVKSLQKIGWTVAMHGLYHLYTTDRGGLFPLNKSSEFAGLPFEKQRQMIAEGKRILSEHGITTDIFMAPSHSYDKETLRALRAEGFRYVTDGFGDDPYEREGLVFLPIAVRKDDALASDRDGITTFVVHTNTMSENELVFYERVLSGKKAVSYEQFFSLPVAKRGAAGNLKEYLTAYAKRAFMIHARKSR